MKVLTIIFCVYLFIIAICLIVPLICDAQLKKCTKTIRELDNIGWHLEHGTSLEEILKMPMPKRLRKEYQKIYEEEKRTNQ